MITNKTLSLLDYFTYISIDIIIYAVGSTSWSYRIFWMVGQVITNPSLGLLSPCEVVPQVLILITEPQEELAKPQPVEDVVHRQGDSNDPSDYTPLSDPDDSDSEPEHVRVATKFHSYGEESPTVPM
jgi:hypothetical protein